MPPCGCGSCNIYEVFNGECESSRLDFTIPGIAPKDRFTLTPFQSVSTNQQHVFLYKLSTVLDLLEQFFSYLSTADPGEVMAFSPEFYGGSAELKAQLQQSSDVAVTLRQHILENGLWIYDEDLERMKEVAKAVGRPDGVESIKKMQLLVAKVVDERTIQTSEVVMYPSYCRLPRMFQFVFILDDEFRRVPFSESVFYALYDRVSKSIKSDGYISFITLQTAISKGLRIRPPA